jgi:hypothetical protein
MKVHTRNHLIIHPSLKISHEALKPVLEKLEEKYEENQKINGLGFQELAAIHPLKCLYGGTQNTKIPLLDN